MASIAEQNIDAVNRAHIDDLMALFAPDATLAHPSGSYTGTDEIANFYTSVVFAGQAITEIDRQFADQDAQIIQIRATSPLAEPGQYVHAVDVFTIGEGVIDRLDIYYR